MAKTRDGERGRTPATSFPGSGEDEEFSSGKIFPDSQLKLYSLLFLIPVLFLSHPLISLFIPLLLLILSSCNFFALHSFIGFLMEISFICILLFPSLFFYTVFSVERCFSLFVSCFHLLLLAFHSCLLPSPFSTRISSISLSSDHPSDYDLLYVVVCNPWKRKRWRWESRDEKRSCLFLFLLLHLLAVSLLLFPSPSFFHLILSFSSSFLGSWEIEVVEQVETPQKFSHHSLPSLPLFPSVFDQILHHVPSVSFESAEVISVRESERDNLFSRTPGLENEGNISGIFKGNPFGEKVRWHKLPDNFSIWRHMM